MAHNKADIIQNTSDCVRTLDTQIDTYKGAISALSKAIAECENAKRAILMIAANPEGNEPPLDLVQPVGGVVGGPTTKGGFVKHLADKIAAAGNNGQ